MNFSPKVSIVIPVYNGSDYLSEAIASALAQTYPNIEVIVVNDGSRDDGATERIALSYGDRIRYFSKENGGVASALNRAIAEMTGEYFSWLSHDDLYTPDKVEREVRMLADTETDRARTIVYADFAAFSDDPADARDIRMGDVRPEDFRYFLTVDNSLHGCTLLIPRTAFEECGTFNEKLRTTQDFDLWFRMAARYRFVHVNAVLVKARHHAAQGSVTMKALALAECNDLLAHFVSDLSESEMRSATSASPSLAYARVAVNFWRRGFYPAARRALELARRNLGRSPRGDVLKVLAILGRIALVDEPKAGVRALLMKLRRAGR